MAEFRAESVVCPILVGRTAPLSALQGLVAQVKEGYGQFALISGEAGLGKSRLVAEIKAYASAQGFLSLQGQCFAADLAYPYAPLLDLLRSLVSADPEAELVTLLEKLAGDIYPLLPELVADRIIQPLHLEPEQEKHRLFALLTRFFLQLSFRKPLLLVVEDIHWSDDTSLDFWHYLRRRCVSHPLLLIATYRDDEQHLPLRGWLAQLNRERLAREFRLSQLARGEVEAMLEALFAQRHTSVNMHRFLHEELLDTFYTLTEGNPFFIEEITSSLLGSGDIFYEQGSWKRKPGEIKLPPGVQGVIQQRMARVSEESRYALTLAAVAGRQFDFALLQQLTRYAEPQLLRVMKELVAAQLIVETLADRFAFRHALTRQAIYAQLLTRESRGLHLMIAQTIEQQSFALDLHLEDLAYHYYQARVWSKVLEYARRAGEKALQLYAHRAALNYYTWALEAFMQMKQSAPSNFYRARGQVYEALGEFEQAQREYTLALDAARIAQDQRSAWQSTLDLGFLWAGRDYGQAESWLRQALLLAQELADPALHARSLNRLGNWYLNGEQPREALHYHQEALAIFQKLQDHPGIAETLDLLGMTSYLGGNLVDGTVYYQQAVALFREQGDKSGLSSSLATMTLRASTFQTDALFSAGSLAEAEHDARQALSLARESGHRSAEIYALFQLGLCQGSRGEYGAALATARQSLELAEEIGHSQWQTAARTVLGGIYSGLLASSQAREQFEQALELAQRIGSLFWTRISTGYLATAAILSGDLVLAEKVLQAIEPSDIVAQTMAGRMVWCARVEFALAQGRVAQALTMIEALQNSPASESRAGESLRILKLHGETLLALQRFVEAEALLLRAQELADMQGALPLRWRVSLTLGKLYQSQERYGEAERAFASAHELVEELALRIHEDILRDQFLQQASNLFSATRLSPEKRRVGQAFGGLTARECEVATLVARGKSNQAIAEALVVTKRTVETHIGNIMFKLGYTSRTQIAVWAVEKGLVSHATDSST